MLDLRKNKLVSMNRQGFPGSPYFAIRKNKVAWPTLRKAYITDENVELLKKYIKKAGRSIVFLDGPYETKLNRYVKKNPMERAVFFEFMLRKKGIKGAIQTLVWIGNFHNGSIIHFGPQFPQMQCWLEMAGKEGMLFFEESCYKIYKDIALILYNNNVTDKEVIQFLNLK